MVDETRSVCCMESATSHLSNESACTQELTSYKVVCTAAARAHDWYLTMVYCMTCKEAQKIQLTSSLVYIASPFLLFLVIVQ